MPVVGEKRGTVQCGEILEGRRDCCYRIPCLLICRQEEPPWLLRRRSMSRCALRDRLLDLSSRHPLINFKLTRENGLPVSHPWQGKVYQRLVQARQAWSFWTSPQEEDTAWDLGKYQPKGHELVCGNLGRRRLGHTLTPHSRRPS